MSNQIQIRDFACIKSADLNLSVLTIIIGPQASGKSVVSKLAYFCRETVEELYTSIHRAQSLHDHKIALVEKFKRWFPSSGWGSKDFQITFTSGEFTCDIRRTATKNPLPTEVKIVYPSVVEELYESAYSIVSETVSSRQMKLEGPSLAKRELDKRSATAEQFMDDLAELSENSISDWQIFIPAGRSFFTSQYKTASTFSKFDTLDPLLIEFGRYYGYIRESGMASLSDKTDKSQVFASPIIEKLLGGEVIISKDAANIVFPDGRTLPFFYLSSGQQEILPLLLLMHVFARGKTGLTYIEEPEAHLFPESQSILLKYLVSLISEQTGENPRLLLTTHSPYILARINNLIKASQLGTKASTRLQKKIERIVPRSAWIQTGHIAAFAIEKGHLKSIINEDGFVDAEYLDSVSDDISKELSSLIQIEIDNEL